MQGSAIDINSAGEVVMQLGAQAFLYSGGVMTELGSLGGSSCPAGINDAGQVVGYSGTSNGVQAFLYSNGTMRDLNSLIDPACGWYLESAQAINDNGQIVGYGTFAGQTEAFLLSPVPEPATLSLLALGGLVALRRRR